MKNLMLFLLFGATFVSAISAQNSVIPIAIGEDLLGGTENGKWIKAEQIDRQFKDKTEFKLITFTEIGLGVFIGTKADRGVCENARITFAKLDGEAEDNDEQNLLLGTFADWDPLPRLPKKIVLSNKDNQKIVADFLKTKRIGKTKIKITQAFQIDLDGDGTKEILIAANYYKRGETEEQSIGDYSFVLLRKMVNGKLQNILIDGEFFTKRSAYAPPNIREIAPLADLNGDGKMEIILKSYYYEGNWKAVFEISKNKLNKVLEVECGA